MYLQEYLNSLKDRSVAVIGIGVSNTPLIRLLLQNGIDVTACDKRSRADLGTLAEDARYFELENPFSGTGS